MQAMILASGVGRRLQPFTDDTPKALLPVEGDKTILDLLLHGISGCGIEDVIITTGHLANKLETSATENYPDLKLTFVKNDLYDTTNYIYSMWLARNYINDDLLLMHGDMIVEHGLLKELCGQPDSVLVNDSITPPEKDFKAEIENGYVTKIGVDLNKNSAIFLAPVYSVSREVFTRWMDVIDSYVKRGELNCYAENPLNEILGEEIIKPYYYKNRLCMEIDTHNDLELARELLADGN